MKPAVNLVLVAALAATGLATAGCGPRAFSEVPESSVGAGSEAKAAASGVVVTVIDANSKPVKGAAVSIADASGKALAADTPTDAKGAATFAKLPPGRGYVATARSAGLTATHVLDVEGEDQVIVTVMIAPANGLRGTIGGSVFDGYTGQALDGATVSVAGVAASTHTNPDGSFLLKDVPAGNPTVVATFPGFSEQRQALTLRGGQLVRADLRLMPATKGYRFGHTLIATAATILEVDKTGTKLWSTRKGGAQAHALMNGRVLIAATNGVDEVDPNNGNAVAWSYKPGLFGGLSNVQAAHRAASGNTFIADTGNNRVIEVSTSNQIQRQVKVDLSQPMDVQRLDDTKTTLIADTGHNRVIEVDDAGRMVWAFGDGSSSTLNRPSHAERLPSGNVLITDSGNSRILEVTHTMDVRLAWSYGDNTRATCAYPSSAVRLPNGRTLIADTGNQRVIEVDKNGAIAWKLDVEAPLYAERL